VTRVEALLAVLDRVHRWRKAYAAERPTAHDYLHLIARQVKVASRAEHPDTPRACLERIAAFAVLALADEPDEEWP
jgi:hypothetical protein